MLLGPVTRSSKMTCQERWDRDLVGPEETRRPEVDLRNALRGWVFAESRRGDLLGMGKIGTSIKG